MRFSNVHIPKFSSKKFEKSQHTTQTILFLKALDKGVSRLCSACTFFKAINPFHELIFMHINFPYRIIFNHLKHPLITQLTRNLRVENIRHNSKYLFFVSRVCI